MYEDEAAKRQETEAQDSPIEFVFAESATVSRAKALRPAGALRRAEPKP